MDKLATDYKYLGGSDKKYPTGKVYPKTIYASPVIDSMMIEWSKDAMQYTIIMEILILKVIIHILIL